MALSPLSMIPAILVLHSRPAHADRVGLPGRLAGSAWPQLTTVVRGDRRVCSVDMDGHPPHLGVVGADRGRRGPDRVRDLSAGSTRHSTPHQCPAPDEQVHRIGPVRALTAARTGGGPARRCCSSAPQRVWPSVPPGWGPRDRVAEAFSSHWPRPRSRCRSWPTRSPATDSIRRWSAQGVDGKAQCRAGGGHPDRHRSYGVVQGNSRPVAA